MTYHINNYNIYLAFSKNNSHVRLCTKPLTLTQHDDGYAAQLLRDVDFSLLINKNEKIKFSFYAVNSNKIRIWLRNNDNKYKYRYRLVPDVIIDYLNNSKNFSVNFVNEIKYLYSFDYKPEYISITKNGLRYHDKHAVIKTNILHNILYDKLPLEVIDRIISYLSVTTKLKLSVIAYDYLKGECDKHTISDKLFISNPCFTMPKHIINKLYT